MCGEDTPARRAVHDDVPLAEDDVEWWITNLERLRFRARGKRPAAGVRAGELRSMLEIDSVSHIVQTIRRSAAVDAKVLSGHLLGVSNASKMYRAQLALLVTEPPSGPMWLHELKLDGYRIGAIIDGAKVRLLSRRGNDWTAEFPELVESARELRVKKVLLDGEVVMLSESGLSSFEALQKRGTHRGELAFFAFDVLSLDGDDVAREPLVERKRRLRDLIGTGVGIIRYTEHFDDDGDKVLRQACALGAEGIVSKRRDAPYRFGARHADWQ